MEKEFWIDFVEGKMSVQEMLTVVKKNKKLLSWINKKVKPDENMTLVEEVVLKNGSKKIEYKTEHFEASKYIENELKSKNTVLSKHLNIFSTFARILTEAYPNDNIKIDETLKAKYEFLLATCPDYIGGEQAEVLIENLLNANPNISKKQFKEEIKNLFNIEKGKYPKWLQSPEWPVSKKGKPMKFVKQVSDKKTGITQYVFEDIDTKKETTIEQFT